MYCRLFRGQVSHYTENSAFYLFVAAQFVNTAIVVVMVV